jgi:site-specific DNA-cytosine methylase
MHSYWLKVMKKCGYAYEQYLLSPDETIGLPNMRNRYYFIATWKGSSVDGSNASSITAGVRSEDVWKKEEEEDEIEELVRCNEVAEAHQPPQQPSSTTMIMEDSDDEEQEQQEEDGIVKDAEEEGESSNRGKKIVAGIAKDLSMLIHHPDIKTTLPFSILQHHHSQYTTTTSTTIHTPTSTTTMPTTVQRIGDILHDITIPHHELPPLLVPLKILQSSWAPKMLSLVTMDDRLTYCFTKGYGKIYDHSAGSCIWMIDSSQVEAGRLLIGKDLVRDRLVEYHGAIRLFHPKELLALFGFPKEFAWPEELSISQQFSCMGNSINVAVVRAVMHRMFAL